jgi:CubicO group peptidase (beta-lactamase class C family)
MQQSLIIITICFALAACSAVSKPTAAGSKQDAKQTPSFEAEAKRAMQAYASTGMVLSVMQPNKPITVLAFGKSDEVKGNAVTTDTLFPIASISKAFTSTALAILVDRGLVEWDAPIRNYIPEFAMYDPWVSEHFTVRDALTHRSGLPLGAGDLLFWPDAAPSSADIIKALPYLKPTSGFRTQYAYDNLLYIVAGEIVARRSGLSWAEFVDKEIFMPVGLSQCAADISHIKPGQKVVMGHERAATDTKGTPLDPRMNFAPSIAAAAGIYCTAADMMVWAKFWLDHGVTKDGKQLVSETQLNELWTGVTPVPLRKVLKDNGAAHYSMYALGWFVQDFEGSRMITHSGGAPGVVSNFILLPDDGVAIFASANDYIAAPHAVTYQLANQLVGKKDFDYIGAMSASYTRSVNAAKSAITNVQSAPENAVPPSLSLSSYEGIYHDPWYGKVTISMIAGGLHIDMSRSNLLDGPLTSYDGDTFLAIWPNRTLKADAKVEFSVEDGKVKGFKMHAIADITDFSYDFHDLNFTKILDK